MHQLQSVHSMAGFHIISSTTQYIWFAMVAIAEPFGFFFFSTVIVKKKQKVQLSLPSQTRCTDDRRNNFAKITLVLFRQSKLWSLQ